MTYPHLISRSLELAAQWHQGQMRKHPSKQIPYIAHPAAVGMMLSRAGADDETVAAGILHDVIEDCGVSKDELAAATSPRIAELVSWVTEPPKSVAWAERKAAYRKKLADAPEDALLIASADHIHNLQSIVDAAQTSEDIWQQFHGDRASRLANEREILSIISSRIRSPLLAIHAAVLDEVERLP